MKYLLNILYGSILIVLFSLSVKSQTNQCLKIGLNIGSPNRYNGQYNMFKDLMKSSTDFTTPMNVDNYSFIPTDENGYPNAGLPTSVVAYTNASGFQTFNNQYIQTLMMQNTSQDFPWGAAGTPTDSCGLYTLFWEGAGTIDITYNKYVGSVVGVTSRLITSVCGTITTSGSSFYGGTKVPNAGILGASVRTVTSSNMPGLHYIQFRIPNGLNTDSRRGIELTIMVSSPAPDHVRNIALVYPNARALGTSQGINPAMTKILPTEAYDAFANPQNPEFYLNKPFNPMFLNWCRGFKILRMMGAMGANSIDYTYDMTWTTRRPKGYYSQSSFHDGKVGVSMAYEWLIDIVNETKSDIWINASATGDENHYQQMAKLFHDNLDPSLNLYLEVGNEQWNYAQGFNTFFVLNNYASTNNLSGGVSEACAIKEGQLWNSFFNEYGIDSTKCKRVMSGFAGNPDVTRQKLVQHLKYKQNWDYFSTTWYFSNTGPLTGAESTYWGGVGDITGPYSASSTTPVQYNAEAKARLGTPKEVGGYMGEILAMTNMASIYQKKVLGYEGGLGSWESSGRTQEDPAKMAKFDFSVRDVYRVALDSIRNHPEIEAVNQFCDFGGGVSGPQNGGIHGYGVVPAIMSDTSSTGNSTYPTTFGPYNVTGTNKHAVWKELIAQQYKPSICEPQAVSDNTGPGNALEFNDVRFQYVDYISATNLNNVADFSYEVWVKPEDANKTMDLVAFTHQSNSSLNVLRIDAANKINWIINNTAGSSIVNLTGGLLTAGNWYHLAAVKQGNNYKLFVNGTVVANGSGTGIYSSNRINLGASIVNSGVVSNYFNGQLDELRIWNGASLSTSSVRNYMCKKLNVLHPNNANLSNYIVFNSVTGSNLFDLQTGTYANNALNNFTSVTGTLYYVTSGAPIGDESMNIYPGAWPGATLTYTNPNGGDIIQISGMGGGLPDGAHLYVVDKAPTLNALPYYYTSVGQTRYYGVFMANGAGPGYDIKYYYLGNPGASGFDNYNRLVKRDNNADPSWVNGAAVIDQISKSLTINCRETYRAEYNIGVRQNNLQPRTGSGNAISFNTGSFTGEGGMMRNFYRTNDYTVSFWAYPHDGDGGNVVWFGASPGGSTGYQGGGDNMYALFNNGSLYTRFNGLIFGNGNNGVPGAAANQWNHYAITKQGTALNLYINGMLNTSGVDPNQYFYSDMFIGSPGVEFSSEYEGDIDEMSIWSTALSQNEIRDLMCKKITPSHPEYCNLKAYFRFDQGAGNVIENEVGPGDMVLDGGRWITSGAALGDQSTYNYSTPYGVTFYHPDGDALNLAYLVRGANQLGTQLYRVDEAPYYTGTVPSGINSMDNSRYWGVYEIGMQDWNTSAYNMNYKLTYNYAPDKNINLGKESTLTAIDRKQNDAMNWNLFSTAITDNTAKTITLIPDAYTIAGADVTARTITIPGHDFNTCDMISYYYTGPTGMMSQNAQYHVRVIDPNTISLHSYYNTTDCASGASPQGFSAMPAGTQYFIKVNTFRRDEIWVANSDPAGFVNSAAVPTIAGITGKANVCQGESGLTYSIKAPVDYNATQFIWSGSAGLAVGISNKDTVSVSVISSGPSVETLSVVGVNKNGKSAPPTVFSITVTGTGYLSADIVGPYAVCAPNGNVNYSISGVSPVPLAYYWTVSGVASFSNVSTGPAIQLDFANTPGSVILSVYGSYACGNALINTFTIKNNKGPDVNLSVKGDTVCSPFSAIDPTITIYASELGVLYSAYDITSAPTFIGSVSGTGGPIRIVYPLASLPIWSNRIIQIKASNNPCVTYTLNNNANIMVSTTLTGAELAGVSFNGPTLPACYAGGAINLYDITLTGTRGGVTYTPYVFDYNQNYPYYQFAYKLGDDVVAQGNQAVLEVQPAAFQYWYSFTRPNTIGGEAMAPGCPSQKLPNSYLMQLKRSSGVAVPSKIAGYPIGLRQSGDDDVSRGYCTADNGLFFTTAWGGNADVFTSREVYGNSISGNPNITISGKSINLADIDIGDVLFTISSVGEPAAYGFNLNGNALYVISKTASTLQVSLSPGGAVIAPSASITNFRFWCPVTIPQITSGSQVITIPAKYANHGLRLYSQVTFSNTSALASYLPSPVSCTSCDHNYYVASISGNNFILSRMANQWIGSQEKSQHYNVERGTLSLTNGNNMVYGSGTRFGGNLYGGLVVQAGDILRDDNDAVIGIVATVYNSTSLGLTANFTGATRSGVTYGFMRPQTYGNSSFGTNAKAVVITAPTDAWDGSSSIGNGFDWQVTPLDAVVSIVGLGGTYIPSTGEYLNNATPISSGVNTAAGEGFSARVKNSIRVIWNDTFSGSAFVASRAKNECGTTVYNITEAYTPGYERTMVRTNIRAKIPGIPDSINFPNVALCKNPGRSIFTTAANTSGGYQWQTLNSGNSTMYLPFYSCGGCQYDFVSTVPGAKIDGGSCASNPGVRDDCVANGGTAGINWDPAFTGVATIRVRAYGCDQVTASQWVTTNVTILGSTDVTANISGQSSICASPGVPNQYYLSASTGAIDSQKWFLLPAAMEDIYSGLIGYYPLDGLSTSTGVTPNASISPQSLGTNVDMTKSGTVNTVANPLGVSDRAANFGGGGGYFTTPANVGYDFGNELTLSAWINYINDGTDTPYIIFSKGNRYQNADCCGQNPAGAMMIGLGQGTGANRKLVVYWDDLISQLETSLDSPYTGDSYGDNKTIAGIVSNVITPGVWHHVAVTIKPQPGSIINVIAYVDGVQSGATLTVPGKVIPPIFPDEERIGGMKNSGHNFKGLIDELALYNRALSLAEVRTLNTITGLRITNPSDTIGNIGVTSGLLTWIPTFTGPAKIVAVPRVCGGDAHPVYYTVTVTSQPTVTGIAITDPANCTPGASGTLLVSLTGVTAWASGTLFDLDLNGGGYGGTNGKVGTISGVSIVSVTSGLPSGYSISQVRIRQKGNLCNAAPDPTYLAPARVITGGITPSSAVPVAINSINAQCSGDDAIVRLTGSEINMSYFAKINSNVVSGTITGTGGIIDLSISGTGVLTSSGVNTNYTVQVFAANPGCTVVGLTNIPVITVNGPSLAGTISGTNPVCFGNNSILTLSGYNGTIQWLTSTNSGASFMNTGITSPVYNTIPLTSAAMFSAIITNGACNAVTNTGITISVDGTSLAGTISGVAPLCSGNSLVLSLAGYNGIPQWQSSIDAGASWSNVSGSNTYPTGALTTTTTYRVIVTSGVCTPATLGGANIVVSAVPVAGSLVGGGNVITLSGSTGSITLSGQTGSILGWQKRFNAGAYIDISGTSGQNPFSETPTAAGLWEYRAVIQSGVCATVASAPVMVTVVGVGGTVSLIAPNLPTACINSSTQLTLTGHSGSILRWEVSTNSGVSWISISDTADVLNYGSLSVATNWLFRGVVTGNQYSGAQTIVVSPLTNAGNISPASQTICNNSGASLTLTGFTPSIVKWIYSDDGGTTWTDFANAGVSIISTGNLTANRIFETIVQSPGCSVLTTTSVLVSVSGASQAGTALADGTPVSINKYAGSNAVLSVTTMTGTLLDWKSGTSALGPFSTSLGTTGTITGLTAGSLYYVAIVQNGGALCTTAQSVPVQINVNNAVMVASFTGGNIALCINNASASGVSFTDLSSAASQGPVLGWSWNFDGGIAANGNNVSNPGIVKWTTPGVKTILLSITGFATPSTFTQIVTIDGAVAFGALAANYTDICEGAGIQSINLTVTSSPASSTISYQQSADNLFTAPFTLSASSGIDPGPSGVYYFRAMGINGTCSVPGYSGMVTVSVTAPINPGSSISYNGGLPLCSDATGLFPASGITSVSGGVFTSAPQLNVNAATGALNVASSTGVSNGFVNYAIPNLHNCGVKTVSGTVTITLKPNASINYAVKSYCNNYDTDDILPIVSQPGGSFSSVPAGLVDAGNGHVFPAGKMPALYKIFYTIAPGGGCTSSSVGTVSGGFTITAAPSVPGFAYINPVPFGNVHAYCKNSLFVPTPSYSIPPAGGSYLSNSSDLVFKDASSGEVDLVNSKTGSYQITYMMGGSSTCKAASSIVPADVTINAAPDKPVFSFGASSYCSNGNRPAIINGSTLTGGFYSSNPGSGLEINGGVVYSISGSGLKTVYYTVSVAGCDPTNSRGEASFTYTEVPAIPGFVYDASEPEYTSSVFCNQGDKDPITAGVFTGGTFSYANLLGDTISKLSLSADNGHINLGKSDPGVWQVSYVVPETGGCKQTPASFVLTVTSSVGGKITANVPQEGICEGTNATLLLSDNRGNTIKWYEVIGTKLIPIPQDTNSTSIITGTLSGKTHYFRALVNNGYCNADTSAIVSVKVSTMPVAGLASVFNPENNKVSSSETVVCQELALITLTGYTGSVQWQMSSDSSSIAWNNVTNNATATTHVLGTYGPAGTSTSANEVKEYFKAKVVNGACTTPAYSNWIKVAKCHQDLYIPNALTPNSGDNNSVWDISKLRLTSNAEVKIFNRYGTVVYSASGDKMDAWDGGGLAAGTYYYVIEFNDGIVPKKTGAVTIVK